MKTKIMSRFFLVLLISLFMAGNVWAKLDTRLKLVDKIVDPSTSTGAITVALEVKGDGVVHKIRGFQNAFQLDPSLTNHLKAVTFKEVVFPKRTDGDGYVTTADSLIYTLSELKYTRVRFIFAHFSGSYVEIPAIMDWISLLQVEIKYDLLPDTAKVTWFPNPYQPTYLVTEDNGNDLTGEEIQIDPFLAEFVMNNTFVPVELASFEARSEDGAAQLSWRTGSETDNLGFRVYRSFNKSGPFLALNQKMIPGAGTVSAEQSYSFVDEDVVIGQTYYYKLADISINGTITMHAPVMVEIAAPSVYDLGQNYPNPFNPETTIIFKLKSEGMVKLDVFNIWGQKIRTLIDATFKAGKHHVVFDGCSDNGLKLPTGTYLYRLETKEFSAIKKMLIVK